MAERMASRVISLLSLLLLPTASSAAESVYDIEAEDLDELDKRVTILEEKPGVSMISLDHTELGWA